MAEQEIEFIFNPTGWGPPLGYVMKQFEGIPFAPFDKSEKIGKIVDFVTTSGIKQKDRIRGDYKSAMLDDEDPSFAIVEHKDKLRKTGANRPKYVNKAPVAVDSVPNNSRNMPQRVSANKKRHYIPYQGNTWAKNPKYASRNRLVQEMMTQIKPTWSLISEFQRQSLEKMQVTNREAIKDLYTCGEIHPYDTKYDKCNTRKSYDLKKTDVNFYNITTVEDETFEKLAQSDEANVFATDAIISMIMSSPRAVLPWSVKINKLGNKLLLFNEEESLINYYTNKETANEPPFEDEKKLYKESTAIINYFSQQALKIGEQNSYSFENPNHLVDFEGQQETAKVGYRYRLWSLGENIKICIRSKVDAYLPSSDDEPQFVNIYAFNETDSSKQSSWKKTLDANKGSCLTEELIANGGKVARWTLQAHMAGADLMKIAYVSRNPTKDKNNYQHTILGVETKTVSELASNINLNFNNSWAIVRAIIDTVLQQEDGLYMLTKDPYKQSLRLYQVDGIDEIEEEDEDKDYYE